MLDQDKIINFIKTAGPTLPAKVAKNIGTEIFIASAHLSFLASQGKIMISKLKIGGSPLYYLQGQESQLYPFAAGNINPKELIVLDRLKEEKVLREAELDLLAKVALRSLKDFATPLHVTVKGRRELFWRWHLLGPEQTKETIGEILRSAYPEESNDNLIENKVVAVVPETVKNENVEIADVPMKEEEKPVLISPKEEPINVPLKEENKKLPQPIQVIKEEPIKHEPIIISKETKQKKLNGINKQKEELEKIVEVKPERKKRVAIQDSFLPLVKEFLKKLDILVGNLEVVRKNSEFNLKVKVKSVVGETEYFCKARKKHRVDEKDVSAAYMEAQIQKLPLIFLYTNQITKKAEEMLKNDAFSNAIVKRIG
jgi:hypothetical protein